MTTLMSGDDGGPAVTASSLPYVGTGVLLAGISGWFTYRMFDGLSRAHGAIERFEATYGPLDIRNGAVDHSTGPAGALDELCEQVDAAVGFLYPFGSALVIPLLLVWLVAILLLFVNRRRWGVAMFGLIAAAVVVGSVSFAGDFSTILAILE